MIKRLIILLLLALSPVCVAAQPVSLQGDKVLIQASSDGVEIDADSNVRFVIDPDGTSPLSITIDSTGFTSLPLSGDLTLGNSSCIDLTDTGGAEECALQLDGNDDVILRAYSDDLFLTAVDDIFMTTDTVGNQGGPHILTIGGEGEITSSGALNFNTPTQMTVDATVGNLKVNAFRLWNTYNVGADFNFGSDPVTVGGTHFIQGLNVDLSDVDIDSGITDSGYRMGMSIEGYIDVADFEGTLDESYGALIRNGTYGTSPTGTITTTYALYLDTLKGANATHTNSYGIYQTSQDANTVNFLGNDLILGGTNSVIKGDDLVSDLLISPSSDGTAAGGSFIFLEAINDNGGDLSIETSSNANADMLLRTNGTNSTIDMRSGAGAQALLLEADQDVVVYSNLEADTAGGAAIGSQTNFSGGYFGNGTIENYISYSNGNSSGIVGTNSNHDLELRTNNTRRFKFDNGSPDVTSYGSNLRITTDSTARHIQLDGGGGFASGVGNGGAGISIMGDTSPFGGGDLFLKTGDAADAEMHIQLNNATSVLSIVDAADADQITIDDEGLLTVVASSGGVDASAGTLELPNTTTLPATCSVGQLFHDTDSDDCADTGAGDGALCICKSTNTWALISNF